jgi:two-component system nitrogen regulation response regulator NtrX
VRELANVVSYVLTMADVLELDVADLPARYRLAVPRASQSGDFYSRIEAAERTVLSEAYSAHGGNVSQMALALGMDRSHLHTKLKFHRIHAPKRAQV